jgi:hypothetical protein
LTFVNVTTPTAPKAVLPTKFAVAEKHMVGFSPGGRITSIAAKRKIFFTALHFCAGRVHQALG